MPTTLATKQAAIKLQVSPNTLRNWSDQYADFLSEAARPGHLPERKFADKDMTVLTYIKQLRAEGMKEDSIKTRLSETKFNDTEILQAGTSALQVDVAIASVDAQDARDGSFAPIVGQDYLMSIERRFEALQVSVDEVKRTPVTSQRDGVIMFGVGFVAALLLMIAIIGLAVLYGGFR
jgi:DNA-binding transcriptional MerR regulator